MVQSMLFEVKENIGWITFNRPEKLNAFNEEMWNALKNHLVMLGERKDVEVLVLTGRGRAFSAGDDIAEMFKREDPESNWDFFMEAVYPALHAFTETCKPVIAAVNGLAYGGGCEITLLCDMVIASEKAVFAVPEPLIGAWPPIATLILSEIVGRRRATEMILTGKPILAADALEIGLVNKVVPPGKLIEETTETARKIAALPNLSVKIIKTWLNRQLKNKLFEHAIKDLILLSQTKGYREGVKNFIKRKKQS